MDHCRAVKGQRAREGQKLRWSGDHLTICSLCANIANYIVVWILLSLITAVITMPPGLSI